MTAETERTPSWPCACCGCATLKFSPWEDGHEGCPVCCWTDDQVQSRDPNFPGGANDVSLSEARENYRKLGVSDPQWIAYARPPRPDETPV
ncbi:CPCC family cysteine-rich protein [Phenylobacterium sp.]|uniref:CPCC family cysteine-rich protein n=1 Tax=Phenylobacterium sp. TaxID=1871053 RepID=UPI002899EB7C|nr:CPCC family cysteine-rich protein [Phenylobacterium sp.]